MNARTILGAVMAIGLAASPHAAYAAHGKAGLWRITLKMNMGGMFTPQQLRKMRAMGLKMPTDSTSTHEHCMTAQEIAMDKPPPTFGRDKQCRMENVKISGQSFSSDTVCTGDMRGTGHARVTFDGAEHYSGQVSFAGTMRGHPANMTMTIDGKWLSAACKAAH